MPDIMKENRGKALTVLLLCAATVFFSSCHHEGKAIRQMCMEIHEQYPLATLQDVYKTCYQDYFGAEHLMRDTASARRYLEAELQSCRDTDMSAMPKRESTGFRHRFTRVNLVCVTNNELSEEQLLELFIDAAGKDNSLGDSWFNEWQKIERIALEVCPEWADEPLQAELSKAADGNHAVRHSESFRNAYNPHYRIVRASSMMAFDSLKVQSDVSLDLGITEEDSLPRTDGRRAFVNLADVIPDALLEIRYYSTYNFLGKRVDGYLEPVALLTRQAADSLRAVSDELVKQGYRLKIYDAYRPQCAVDHFVRWAADVTDTLMKPYFYPKVPRNKLFELGYIAKKSGHTRGSTVDLTLFDMTTEKEVDMGGTFDWFGPESHPSFGGDPNTGRYLTNSHITQEQFHNRMILREAMLRHGFKPVGTEWWHFTLRNEPFPHTYFTFPVKQLNH